MPIYEYRCSACAAELEKLQKISDPVLVDCPGCGKPTLVKLVSASSFRLKGSGWYETDFKTGKKKNGVAESSTDTAAVTGSEAAGTAAKDTPAATTAAAGNKPEGKPAGKTEGKAEATPERKPEGKKGATAAGTAAGGA